MKQTIWHSDLSGQDAETTVRVKLARDSEPFRAWEVDLTEAEAQQLLNLLKPYLANARQISDGRRSADVDAPKIRAWARENGFDVSDRGAIPTHVLKAHRDAHPEEESGDESEEE
jgi:hypothetical protein